MDFANERYVRLYTRDTTTTKLLGWQGRTVLWHMLRKLDRSGVLELEGCEPWELAALHGDLPEDVAREGMANALARGCLVHDGDRIVAPRYIEANETPASDALRARESRERRAAIGVTKRDGAVTERDAGITNRDQTSRAVTPRHAPSRDVTPCRADPIRAVPSVPIRTVPSLDQSCDVPPQPASGPAPRRTRRKQAPPVDPTAQQMATAAIWDAYRVGYKARYDAEPLRNAKVNGQIAQLAKRIPHDEAPAIVAAYLRSQNARYVASGHAIGPLLQDAEAVRTEALTGRSRTAWGAHAADKRDGRAQDYEDLFAELRAHDEAKAAKEMQQ